MSDITHWQVLLDCAQEVSGQDGTPFTRAQLIARVQSLDPDRGASSLSPIIQGMTINAPGGPRSSVGYVFRRVGRGLYEVLDAPETVREAPQRTQRSGGAARRSTPGSPI